MNHSEATYAALAGQMAAAFASLHAVEAVALGGSHGSGAGMTDAASDIDLYIYTRAPIPLADRRALVERTGGATQANLDLNYWGAGDEWFHAPTGIEIDIIYFDAAWMNDQIELVVEKHQASLGYTTCLWYTIQHATILFDPNAWLAELQRRCRVPYPEALRRHIVTLNRPVLRSIIPAYAHQLAKAVQRRDLVSVNHRLAALFASYFDIIFAINRQPHPGEKRQVAFAVNYCRKLPTNMAADISAILLPAQAELSQLPAMVNGLLDRLDDLLAQEGF